ncbi:MAG: reductive dehalogenase [Chloroflexi bacterium]|nr:reductive dehalogenase [Chloroflexota bacterium]
MERLKRVDWPTTLVTDEIKRVDQREDGFVRALRGGLGPAVAGAFCRGYKYPLSAAGAEMSAYLGARAEGDKAASKAPIPEEPEALSRHIKRLGYFYRADIVGISELPQWAVYSHDKEGNPVELSHQSAIVILVDQDYRTMRGSTGNDWISNAQGYLSYSTADFISCIMASYIRRLGYSARAHTVDNSRVVIPPLLLLAGVGEISRPGIVLNPFLGLRFKVAVVTTELPLLPDKPVDFGLQEFCRKCQKCAAGCPARAIPPGDTVVLNGYENWRLDVERCTKFRILNPNGDYCGRCIKVCPWNKPAGRLHDMARWMVAHTPWLDGFLIKMDSIIGYEEQDQAEKWWFDLEDIDGVLQPPGGRRA